MKRINLKVQSINASREISAGVERRDLSWAAVDVGWVAL